MSAGWIVLLVFIFIVVVSISYIIVMKRMDNSARKRSLDEEVEDRSPERLKNWNTKLNSSTARNSEVSVDETPEEFYPKHIQEFAQRKRIQEIEKEKRGNAPSGW